MLVDLEGAVGEIEFAQRDRRAAEAVGLHHVGAGGEIAAMDVAHQVGARQVQHLGAVLLAPVVALDIERQRLHAAAHAAVGQQHGVAQGIEQMGRDIGIPSGGRYGGLGTGEPGIHRGDAACDGGRRA